MLEPDNWNDIQIQLEEKVFSVYHPNLSQCALNELTSQVEQIISEWKITHPLGHGAIDVIDFIEDKITVVRGYNIPFEWLDIIYNTINKQVKLRHRVQYVWRDIPIYFRDTPYIMHFMRSAIKGEYQCLMYLQTLNIMHERYIIEPETTTVTMKYILCNIIRVCELLCEDIEGDYTRSITYSQELHNAPNSDKQLFFEERWCWLTNKRLDTDQSRMNEAASIMLDCRDKYPEEWEEWVKTSNRFYKSANKLASIILNPDFEWVKQQKKDFFNSLDIHKGQYI